MNRLFVIYRLEFHPQTNQDSLAVIAEAAEKRLWDMFDLESENQPVPSPQDITHELVMEHTMTEEERRRGDEASDRRLVEVQAEAKKQGY